VPLAYPAGSSAIVAAVQWVEGTLLGTIATTVAIIAVASVGLMMLSGRISFRRAGTVILGCFVLFGASSIAAGIQAVATGVGGAPAPPVFASIPTPPPPVAPPSEWPTNIDPYAGAAVPER
jgi:type IV secretory pathway VirB2 component (pilin)